MSTEALLITIFQIEIHVLLLIKEIYEIEYFTTS